MVLDYYLQFKGHDRTLAVSSSKARKECSHECFSSNSAILKRLRKFLQNERKNSNGSGLSYLPFMLKYENALRSCYCPQRTQIEKNGLIPYLSTPHQQYLNNLKTIEQESDLLNSPIWQALNS